MIQAELKAIEGKLCVHLKRPDGNDVSNCKRERKLNGPICLVVESLIGIISLLPLTVSWIQNLFGVINSSIWFPILLYCCSDLPPPISPRFFISGSVRSSAPCCQHASRLFRALYSLIHAVILMAKETSTVQGCNGQNRRSAFLTLI